jgi:hypothetical protein
LSGEERSSGRRLRERDFTRIAANGFGDQLNSYAHSMVAFGDSVYVGTTRANFCLVKARLPILMPVWPVNCPKQLADDDLRAHIWRYRIRTGRWENVHVAPWAEGPSGSKVAREIGYREMISYQAPGDSAPCLYVANWANRQGKQVATIFRSTDGTEFVPVSQPGLRDATVTSLRSLVPFRDRIFTAPIGNAGVTPNVPASPVILVSDDVCGQDWKVACAPGFGDEDNKTIFEMAVFDNHLYAGTLNPHRGFQVWKTDAEGEPPYRWRRVLTDGAGRGELNESVVSMCVFQDALYIGTGIQNGGHDVTYDVGPAAAEVIRLYPDDSWDLLVGQARRTRRGHVAPLSGFGPGFDNFFNGYIWRMSEHAGRLYAGTCDWTTLLPFLMAERTGHGSRPERRPPKSGVPQRNGVLQRLVRFLDPENMVRFEGGFDLWSTADGERWLPVTTRGFGNPYNYGLRTMVSTSHGLFVGTANPFGPDIARRGADGWSYAPNAAGGAEIWLARTTRPARAG